MLKRFVNLPFQLLGRAARAVQDRQDAVMRDKHGVGDLSDGPVPTRNLPAFDTPADFEPAGLGWSATELEQALNSPAPPYLVDVRPAGDPRAQRIPGSEHLPLHGLSLRLAELPPEPRRIIFWDDRGEQGREAARFVRFRGHDGAHYLAGGLRAWSAGGRKVDGA